MDWIRLPTSAMTDTRLSLASPAATRGWISVLLYAGQAEVGGVIPGASAWTSRQYLIALRTSKAEVAAAVGAGLLAWTPDGSLSIALGYDGDAEARCLAARANGAKGGRPTQGDASPEPRANPAPNPTATQPATEVESRGEGEPGLTTTPTTGATPVVEIPRTNPGTPMRLDRMALNAALAAKDVVALAGVFGAATEGRAHEWNAATEGLSVQTCLVVLAWRRLEGSSIRQPSGFVQARAGWRELSEPDRVAVGQLVAEATGVVLKVKRAA